MKISKQLPSLVKESALLIVTGKQGAEFYITEKGQINLQNKFEVKPPRYSDKEGFFGGRGSGSKGGASGSVKEINKIENIKDFLRQLKIELQKNFAKKKTFNVYLYAPQYLMRQVKEVVRSVVGESYMMSFTGNYLKQHPTELLKMIGGRADRRAAKKHVVPTTNEATKIIKKKSE